MRRPLWASWMRNSTFTNFAHNGPADGAAVLLYRLHAKQIAPECDHPNVGAAIAGPRGVRHGTDLRRARAGAGCWYALVCAASFGHAKRQLQAPRLSSWTHSHSSRRSQSQIRSGGGTFPWPAVKLRPKCANALCSFIGVHQGKRVRSCWIVRVRWCGQARVAQHERLGVFAQDCSVACGCSAPGPQPADLVLQMQITHAQYNCQQFFAHVHPLLSRCVGTVFTWPTMRDRCRDNCRPLLSPCA